MARQDGETIEQSFLDAVGFCELEDEGLRIEFADEDGLSTNDKQIALRGVHTFIKVDAKSEEHIVGVERMAVRKTQSLAKSECVLKTVGRNFPGFGEGRLRKLRSAIDVNEIGLHCADHFARRSIGGGQRI